VGGVGERAAQYCVQLFEGERLREPADERMAFGMCERSIVRVTTGYDDRCLVIELDEALCALEAPGVTCHDQLHDHSIKAAAVAQRGAIVLDRVGGRRNCFGCGSSTTIET